MPPRRPDEPPRQVELTDPRALRALAHPIRMRLVGLLRIHGTLTATEAGRLLGESSGNASFHLRTLARYGLVEEVPGPGRAKPWRATAEFTSWPATSADPELAAASRLFAGVVAERYIELIKGWVNSRDGEPDEWVEAAWFGDLMVVVTPAELTELRARLDEMLRPYVQRLASERPDGARLVSVLQLAVPRTGLDSPTTGSES